MFNFAHAWPSMNFELHHNADSANLDKMATSSCSLYLKRPHEAGRIELCIEDVRDLTVQKLMDKVAEKISLPIKEFREFVARSFEVVHH